MSARLMHFGRRMTTPAEIRNEMAQTRARMSHTAAELGSLVSDRTAAAAERVDPRTYAREYPWIALAVAVGAGLGLALSGADEKASAAAADGAKSLASAISDGAVDAKAAIIDRVRGSGGRGSAEQENPHTTARSTAPSLADGLQARFAGSVEELLRGGLNEILDSLGRPRAQT